MLVIATPVPLYTRVIVISLPSENEWGVYSESAFLRKWSSDANHHAADTGNGTKGIMEVVRGVQHRAHPMRRLGSAMHFLAADNITTSSQSC